MLKKTVEYSDFLGNQRSKVLYFHLTQTDLQRMIMAESYTDNTRDEDDPDRVRETLTKRIQGVADRGNGKELLELFDWLVQNSYGIIDEDGETFTKSEEIYQKWTMTASYDAFFTNLMNDTDAMTEFVNGIVPRDLKEKADPEFKRHAEELASRRNQGV